MNKYPYLQVFDRAKRRVRGLWLRNGSYYVQTTVTNSASGIKGLTKVRLEADNLEQAKIEASKVKDLAGKGLATFGKVGPTFKAYREHYAQVVHKAPKTLYNELHFLNQWEKFLGADYHVSKITAQNILAYRSEVIRRCSITTANLHVRALRQLLLLAKTEGHLHSIPMDGIKQIKDKHVERRLLTAEEIYSMATESLRSHPRTGVQFAYYLSFLMYSGARCSETVNLRWTDIDFNNEQVLFSGNISKGESRRLDFNKNLRNLLLLMKASTGESPYLFPSFYDDNKIASFKEVMDEVRTAVNLPEFTFHLCRHYFISQCVMRKVDLLTIAKWVGHKDGGILIGKIYGHLNAEHMKDEANKLNI